MKWGCRGHWGYWGCWDCRGHWGFWGSWCMENHTVCKVHIVFDFLTPLRLSCPLRSLRPLIFLKLLRALKSINQGLKSAYFVVLKNNFFWIEWWNFKWNPAILQSWGCGGQGCSFWPNPRVISQMSIVNEHHYEKKFTKNIRSTDILVIYTIYSQIY